MHEAAYLATMATKEAGRLASQKGCKRRVGGRRGGEKTEGCGKVDVVEERELASKDKLHNI